MSSNNQTTKLPSILLTNPFSLRSGNTAKERRAKEEEIQKEVFGFLVSLGFQAERVDDYVQGEHGSYYLEFYYSETSSKVYSYCTVFRDGVEIEFLDFLKFVENGDNFH
jgi:hypothetical protein